MALMFTFSFACSQQSEPDSMPDSPSDNQAPELSFTSAANPTIEYVPIAKLNGKKSPKLLIEKLKGTFADGGKIEYFILRKGDANFNFIRLGKDAKGNTRSEAFQTVAKNGQLSLKLVDELVWFVSCFGSCFGCMPNREGTACDCDVMDYETDENGEITVYDWSGQEIVDWNLDGTTYPTDDCTFGSAGGGLYATHVLF